jgi:hypothetical protein
MSVRYVQGAVQQASNAVFEAPRGAEASAWLSRVNTTQAIFLMLQQTQL